MTHEQLQWIDNHDGGIVNINNPLPPNDRHCTTLLSEETKQWCDDIAAAVSDATGNYKYGRSTVIKEAVEFYRTFYKFRHQLLHRRKMVVAMLENL